MLFRQITDVKLAQFGYLIGCQRTGEALVIDPERDIDRYVAAAEQEGLTITSVTETHIHADFLSGTREFAESGVRVYLSDEGDHQWKYRWPSKGNFNVSYLHHGEAFRVGSIEIQVIHTPGHTPEHLSFLIIDRGAGAGEPMGIISGDFVFVGDLGRPDLLESAANIVGQKEPSARRLYTSVKRFLDLPDFLQLWPGHGAGSVCGKALGAIPQSTVGYERRYNAAIDASNRDEEAFVDMILSDQPEPPLYFARMKALNRDGAPVLGELPTPSRIHADDLPETLARENITILDTRLDTSAFMAQYLPRSLYTPLTRSFTTAVGSVGGDPSRGILLIVDEEHVEEAVRDLVRIGYDHVFAYLTPADLQGYFRQGGAAASIDWIDFDVLDERRTAAEVHVLDVRYGSEFAASHIPGAINISYTRLADRLDEVPNEGPLLVHCATGVRSAVAASLLAREGFDVQYVGDSFTSRTDRRETANEIA